MPWSKLLRRELVWQLGGSALMDASTKIVERAKQVAGAMFEASADDIEFDNTRRSFHDTRIVGIDAWIEFVAHVRADEHADELTRAQLEVV